MSDEPEVPPMSQIVDGLQIPSMLSVESFRSAVNYKPRSDDVFIVTFPKCGTTWYTQVAALILRHGEPFENSAQFFSSSPYLDLGASVVENMPRPGAIKSHLPFRLMPKSDTAKYIYVTRNPKDCCVSYFYHMKKVPGHLAFDDFFERFISGKTDYGDYFDHLMAWYEHRNDPNVLFLTYEEMKKDIEAVIFKMASFIDDEKYAEPLRKSPEMLKNIVEYSSFKSMKEFVNKAMEELFNMPVEDVMKSEFPDEYKKMVIKLEKFKSADDKKKPEPSKFVRKGITGDWRNHLSEEQSRRLDEKFAERMKNSQMADFWKEYMC